MAQRVHLTLLWSLSTCTRFDMPIFYRCYSYLSSIYVFLVAHTSCSGSPEQNQQSLLLLLWARNLNSIHQLFELMCLVQIVSIGRVQNDLLKQYRLQYT